MQRVRLHCVFLLLEAIWLRLFIFCFFVVTMPLLCFSIIFETTSHRRWPWTHSKFVCVAVCLTLNASTVLTAVWCDNLIFIRCLNMQPRWWSICRSWLNEWNDVALALDGQEVHLCCCAQLQSYYLYWMQFKAISPPFILQTCYDGGDRSSYIFVESMKWCRVGPERTGCTCLCVTLCLPLEVLLACDAGSDLNLTICCEHTPRLICICIRWINRIISCCEGSVDRSIELASLAINATSGCDCTVLARFASGVSLLACPRFSIRNFLQKIEKKCKQSTLKQ